MSKSLLNLRYASLRKIVNVLFPWLFGSYFILITLLVSYSILFSAYSALWIGEPVRVTCQNVDFIRIDCILKYQALLRSSEQEIKAIQAMSIDKRELNSDSGTKIEYVAVLQSKSGDYPIATYSNQANPELEVLQHRLNKFIENPEEKLSVSIDYNLWRQLGFIFPIIILIWIWITRFLPPSQHSR